MKKYGRKTIVVVSIVMLALVLAVGGAMADGNEPVSDNTNSSHLVQMLDRMGAENWGQMIQRMTQIHGPEWTAQMLQRMNQNDMPCEGDGTGHMMGQGFGGMFGWRFNRSDRFGSNGMMVR